MSVIKIQEQEFEEKIKSSKNKVIIDCYADWCGPCKMLAPIMDELAEEIDYCDFYKINIDEASEVASKYNIMSIPTLLYFENGNLKDQIVGFKSKEELEEIIKG